MKWIWYHLYFICIDAWNWLKQINTTQSGSVAISYVICLLFIDEQTNRIKRSTSRHEVKHNTVRRKWCACTKLPTPLYLTQHINRRDGNRKSILDMNQICWILYSFFFAGFHLLSTFALVYRAKPKISSLDAQNYILIPCWSICWHKYVIASVCTG